MSVPGGRFLACFGSTKPKHEHLGNRSRFPVDPVDKTVATDAQGATVKFVRLDTLPLMILLVGGSGCHHAMSGASNQNVETAQKPTVQLPETTPSSLTPTVYGSPTGIELLPLRGYRKLTAKMCQELAVQNSRFADAIEVPVPPPSTKRGWSEPPNTGTVLTSAIGFAGQESRNRTAGEALELYHKLVAAEAGFGVTHAAEEELQTLVSEAAKVAKAGLKEPPRTTELEAQLGEVRLERERLAGTIHQLNYAIAHLINYDLPDGVHFWPDAPVVIEQPIDTDAAVQTALQQRPDLQLLRSLQHSTDADSAQIARQVLGGLNPLAGASAVSEQFTLLMKLLIACKYRPDPQAEWDARTRRQLAMLIVDREKQAEAEVRAAVARVNSTSQQARIAAQTVDQLRVRVRELETGLKEGQSVVAKLAETRALWRKANGNLIQAATDHQIAQAKLKQTQGLLVREIVSQ